MSPRRIAVISSIICLVAAICGAQEIARQSDGKLVRVVPDPTFLPDDVIAVAQVSGFMTLAPKIGALLEDLMPPEEIEAAVGRSRRVLGPQSDFPALHPQRPIFIALWDPMETDRPIAGPTDWTDWTTLAGMGVVALPVLNHAMAQSAISRSMKWIDDPDARTKHYAIERRRADYEAWAAAAERDPSTAPDPSAFERVERTDIYYVSAEGYALLTANPVIAAACARVPRGPLSWRIVGDVKRDPGSKNIPTPTIVKEGRFIHPEDDVVLSADFGRFTSRHRATFADTLDRFTADVARRRGVGGQDDPAARQRIALSDGIARLAESLKTTAPTLGKMEFGMTMAADGVRVRSTMSSAGELKDAVAAARSGEGVLTTLAKKTVAATCGEIVFGKANGRISVAGLEQILAMSGAAIDPDSATKFVAEFDGEARAPIALGCDFGDDGRASVIGVAVAPDALAQRFKVDDVVDFCRRAVTIDRAAANAERLDDLRVGDRTLARFRIQTARKPVDILVGRRGDRVAFAIGENPDAASVAEVLGAPIEKSSGPARGGFIDLFRFFGEMRRNVEISTGTPVSSTSGSAFVAKLLMERSSAGRIFLERDGDAATRTFSVHIPKSSMIAYRDVFAETRDMRRFEATRVRIENLAARLGDFKTKHGRFPTVDEGLAAILPTAAASAFERGVARMLQDDGWNRPFIFRIETDGRAVVESLGKDGVRGGEGYDADQSTVVR